MSHPFALSRIPCRR